MVIAGEKVDNIVIASSKGEVISIISDTDILSNKEHDFKVSFYCGELELEDRDGTVFVLDEENLKNKKELGYAKVT